MGCGHCTACCTGRIAAIRGSRLFAPAAAGQDDDNIILSPDRTQEIEHAIKKSINNGGDLRCGK
jgi:hypothetical protein